MTNEEAIKLLNNITSYCDFTDQYGDMIDSEPYYEAVELAIKALEATEQVHTSHSGVQMFPKGVFEAIYKDNEESEGAE